MNNSELIKQLKQYKELIQSERGLTKTTKEYEKIKVLKKDKK
jgi:hypothetical protein